MNKNKMKQLILLCYLRFVVVVVVAVVVVFSFLCLLSILPACVDPLVLLQSNN